MKRGWLLTLVAVLFAAGLSAPVVHADDSHVVRYAVTITNVTRGQVITPPVVVSHNHRFKLFTVGAPAGPELAALAEDGLTAPLTSLLPLLPGVFDVVTATGPILPGASMTIEVKAVGPFRFFTAVGMLATTNDAFFAVQGVAAPRKGEATAEAEAYDAGSEGNSESCAFIPGPPCGSGGVRDTVGAEGYVHIHAGIHGIGHLVPATHDWRNPVAEISIRRIP